MHCTSNFFLSGRALRSLYRRRRRASRRPSPRQPTPRVFEALLAVVVVGHGAHRTRHATRMPTSRSSTAAAAMAAVAMRRGSAFEEFGPWRGAALLGSSADQQCAMAVRRSAADSACGSAEVLMRSAVRSANWGHVALPAALWPPVRRNWARERGHQCGGQCPRQCCVPPSGPGAPSCPTLPKALLVGLASS